MKLSNTLYHGILEALTGNAGNSASSVTIGGYHTAFLALFNGDPGSSGTELSGNGYARVNIYTNMSRTYQSYANGDTADVTYDNRIGNATQIAFPEAVNPSDVDAPTGGDWQAATHWALFTTASGGTPYAWGQLDNSVTVATHEVFIMRKGHFELYIEEASNGN